MLVWKNGEEYNGFLKNDSLESYSMFGSEKKINSSLENQLVLSSSGGKSNSELQDRVHHLEEQLNSIQQQLTNITKSNENTKQDMKFFETMLLEEYHLLLQLLGKDQSIQIHQSPNI